MGYYFTNNKFVYGQDFKTLLSIHLLNLSGSQGSHSLTWLLLGKGRVHAGEVASLSEGHTITGENQCMHAHMQTGPSWELK